MGALKGSVETVLEALHIPVVESWRGELWALCPFHNDRKPSWSICVRAHRYGAYHCFSCKVGGTLPDLVKHVRGCTQEEAEEWIEALGGEVPPPPPLPEETLIVDVAATRKTTLEMPSEVITGPLHTWVTPARAYMEHRKIPPEQVEDWGLGYAVDGRLGSRVVLPVVSQHRRLANYMARTFVNDKRRYLTPRAEEGRDDNVLFGEVKWPPLEYRKHHMVVVTEGGFNALAVERATRCLVAALGGSDVHGTNMPALAGVKLGLFGEVVVLTDPDASGDKVAMHLCGLLARQACIVRRVRLPEHGPDIDEHEPEALRRWILPS